MRPCWLGSQAPNRRIQGPFSQDPRPISPFVWKGYIWPFSGPRSSSDRHQSLEHSCQGTGRFLFSQRPPRPFWPGLLSFEKVESGDFELWLFGGFLLNRPGIFI